jgi:DNA-binding LacI/PurR family transcriptional regulator
LALLYNSVHISEEPCRMGEATRKFELVRERLVRKIRSGSIPAGRRLPGERRIAEKYGVSHMTARRAVTEVVRLGLAERRGRAGTFVSRSAGGAPSAVTVRVVCLGFEEPAYPLVRHAKQHARMRGWGLRVVQCSGMGESRAAEVVASGEPVLILSDEKGLRGAVGGAARAAGGRAVVVGNRLDQVGVPSVLCDDAHGVRLAMEHLFGNGHERIAVLSQDPGGCIESTMVSAWRSCLVGRSTEEDLRRRLLTVNAPRFENSTPYAFEATGEYLRSPRCDATALLCLTERVAIGALAACRQAGMEVPARMSLVAFGNTTVTEFSSPPVTAVDVDYESHISEAFGIIDSALGGKRVTGDLLRLIEPRLVIRGSVGKAPASRKR